MRNKIMLLSLALVCCTALVAGFARPYRWWPWNDMAEQHIIKPFNQDGLRAPAEGSVAIDAWEPVPKPMDLLTQPDQWTHFKNPVAKTPESLAKGKELYEVYCISCHSVDLGVNPDTKSPVAKGGKSYYREGAEFTGMPAAAPQLIKMRSDEQVFAVLTHGSAIMKRVSYNLSPEERWHVVNYVKDLADKSPNP
ncbi:c-type cytochrome [Acanthopleuribacter pedis]|uniref:Cytochrome c n=1 Tax=Acanthopleuribacter pedis TaxID=442870 RepID=A0A8J7Q8H7_9BACT|nr:cytochrome c [Acanthopleuribacter pedis]MBO1320446.1 cytochrome c [Acanthopleuribacter pedis]